MSVLRPHSEYESQAKAEAFKKHKPKMIPAAVIAAIAGAVITAVFASPPAAIALAAVAGAGLGPLLIAAYALIEASGKADERYMLDWCALNGFRYLGEYEPPNAPYADSGYKQESSDAVEGVAGELPFVFWNFSYYTKQSNGKTTTTVEHPYRMLRIWGAELPIERLSFSERGALSFKMFDKLDSALSNQRQVSLESDDFNSRFDLEIADSADDIWIRRVFDPPTIVALLDGSLKIPGLQYYDRCFWLVETGHYDVEEIETMKSWQASAVPAIRHLARVDSL